MRSAGVWLAAATIAFYMARAQANQAESEQDDRSRHQQGTAEDPFADVAPATPRQSDDSEQRSWIRNFFDENFGFRKEIMSEVDASHGDWASRQSIGFELLKKFSTTTSTVASFNFQGRFVRRDGFNGVLNDMEGAQRQGWAFEYHNLYLDFYNVFDSLLSDKQRNENVGRFNFRAGRFYVPFGLNLQTDTHGTVLQLSNERDFGFERDWYAGFWGRLNKDVNYDAYYLAGSGYELKFKGQSGLGALRISLAEKYSSDYGLEGGVSIVGGQRLASSMSAVDRMLTIDTERIGLDGRYRRSVPTGLLTFSTELSGGRDSSNPVTMQLYQPEYLHRSRRWGLATQYRRYQQRGLASESSIVGEVTWYFRNDAGNSNLHWIKLNVDRQLSSLQHRPATIVILQYYFYR